MLTADAAGKTVSLPPENGPTVWLVLDLAPKKRGSMETELVALGARLAAAGARATFVFSRPAPAWMAAALAAAGVETRVLDFRRPAVAALDFTRMMETARPAELVHFHFVRAYSPLVAVGQGGRRARHPARPHHARAAGRTRMRRRGPKAASLLARGYKRARAAAMNGFVDRRIAVSRFVADSVQCAEFVADEQADGDRERHRARRASAAATAPRCAASCAPTRPQGRRLRVAPRAGEGRRSAHPRHGARRARRAAAARRRRARARARARAGGLARPRRSRALPRPAQRRRAHLRRGRRGGDAVAVGRGVRPRRRRGDGGGAAGRRDAPRAPCPSSSAAAAAWWCPSATRSPWPAPSAACSTTTPRGRAWARRRARARMTRFGLSTWVERIMERIRDAGARARRRPGGRHGARRAA